MWIIVNIKTLRQACKFDFEDKEQAEEYLNKYPEVFENCKAFELIN